MSSSLSIFWPLDERNQGYICGWKNARALIVIGVEPFLNRFDAESTILRLNSDLSSKNIGILPPLELLGICSEVSDGLPLHITWEDIVDTQVAEQTCFILYKRHKRRSMRHYSLDGIDLDFLLAIQSCGENLIDHADSRLSLSQAAYMDQQVSLSGGINVSIINQINAAHEIMTILEGYESSKLSVLGEPDRQLSSGAGYSSFFIKAYQWAQSPSAPCKDCITYLGRFIGTWVKPRLASAQQIDLRYEQIAFILRQFWLLGNPGGLSDDKISAQYISTQNCVWLTLNDMIVGTAVGVFLIENRSSLAQAAGQFGKLCTVTLVRKAIYWMDNWPAGLKLNTELSRFLFLIFNALIDMWEDILYFTEEFVPTIILLQGISGVFGMTMILTLLSDMISLLTIHISVSYALVRIAFKNQLVMTNSLFNLFRGKRYNILHRRLDDWNYDLDQLLLGAMLFTLVSFLSPTISVYYVVFALLRLAVIILQAIFEVTLALLNHFPLFALTLRTKDPWRLPGGIVFHVSEEAHLRRRCYTMQNSPISFSRIFSQYSVLGSRLIAYYSPRRLILKLLKGDSLNPIPQQWIRYTYGFQRHYFDKK
ncbi:hypothetical protein M0805_003438 [Coniferiporia weirii]|nr:hypothetical protein M0805_003438 [Coniferiporia weirii]